MKILVDFWSKQEGTWKSSITNKPPRGVGLEAFLNPDASGLDVYITYVQKELFPNVYFEGELHYSAVLEVPHPNCKYTRQHGESMVSFTNRRIMLVEDLEKIYPNMYKLPERKIAKALLDHSRIPLNLKELLEYDLQNQWTTEEVKKRLIVRFEHLHLNELGKMDKSDSHSRSSSSKKQYS